MPELTTSTNRSWLIKMLIVAAVFAGFGVWGLLDAIWVYPARGLNAAIYHQWKFLQSEEVRSRDALTKLYTDPDPAATLAKLSDAASLSASDGHKRLWYTQLSYIGKLNQEHTTIANPAEKLAELTKQFGASATPPKDLTKWDIPLQWVILAVGAGVGLYLVVLIFNVSRAKYRFDESSMTLTLPDGEKIGVDDVQDFDRRRWDKFLMYVQVKPGRTAHGGKELKLDLLRHTPLEDWVVAMEKRAFPDRFKD